MAIQYKGYTIENSTYNKGYITIQYCGDDIVFNSVEEAKSFIDGLD